MGFVAFGASWSTSRAQSSASPDQGFTTSEMATKSCWIDAKTGKRVRTGPVGWSPTGVNPHPYVSSPDPNHVENSVTGQTFVNDPTKGWIDAKTGAPVATGPVGWSPTGVNPHPYVSSPDPNHVENSVTGQTFVRIPCPPVTATTDGRPQILDAPSAAQGGDAIRFHVAGANPFDSTFWFDNRKIDATGVARDSATLTLPMNASLSAHQLVMRSHDQESAVTIHIVNLFADPLATTEPGVVQTVTVHVEGLTDADAGTMYFKTADPAQFVSGNAIDSAPVVGGVATTQIVGVHTGPAVIQFKLVVTPKPAAK
jgi:hypothetical protein